MNDGLLSPHWYRVVRLKPNLYRHVKIHRHEYRGLIWYLLEDTTSGRNHRFNPAAYQFIGLLNGERTVEEIYAQISEQMGDFVPGQEDIIQLLGQLHAADLIQTDVMINTEELFERQLKHKQNKLKQRFSNPVAQKVPLWDPEDFLNRHFNKLSWLFSGWVAIAWLLLIVYSLLQAAQHWPQISQHFTVNALSPYNLIIMFLLYPPIKILHELGHAFSAKLEGGEVHEMGINFLMFMPIPYVNVSAATHFRSKYKRMLVSAAGILVESFLAALGLLLFLATEPGMMHDIGFNIFIIGGISSLFFNGNPLLKYDGYYILADALSIPNLYKRSGQYWCYLIQRYLFGLSSASSPAYAPGENFWFVVYGLLSLVYRFAILWFIIAVVTEKFFIAGVILAIWLIGLQLLLPLSKALHYLTSSPGLTKKRGRAVATSLAVLSLLVALIGFVPIPSYTLTEGVLWQSDEAQLIAGQDGFVGFPDVDNNQLVEAGTSIIRLYDPFLKSQARISQARVRELQSLYRAERLTNRVAAGILKEEIRVAESELNYIIEKIRTMSVVAAKRGRVLLPEVDDLPGRFVRQGELLGYILDDSAPTIRMAVSQDHIGQLRQKIVDIKVRFASDPRSDYPVSIIRQAPEATNLLPSAALSILGGGKFVTIPESGNDLITKEKFFLVDLKFDAEQPDILLGTRAYIRINHGSEAVATQLYRRIRQAFLRQFDV